MCKDWTIDINSVNLIFRVFKGVDEFLRDIDPSHGEEVPVLFYGT